MSYIQFTETSSSNNNHEQVCRICLENDHLNNLIYPCRCTGNSKYIHKHCLNEWRILNANNDRFHKCEICDYRFVVSNNNNYSQHSCFKAANFLINDALLYIIAISLFSYGFSWIVYSLDTNQNIIKTFFGNPTNIDDDIINVCYFIFILSIILILEALFILIAFFFIRNKSLYCSIHKENLTLYILSIIGCILVFFLLDIITFMLCIELFSLYICRNHIHSMKKIYHEDNMTNIDNYNPDTDELVGFE